MYAAQEDEGGIFSIIIDRDSRKSRKHGNHGNRDFCQMPWFCQNTVFFTFLQ